MRKYLRINSIEVFLILGFIISTFSFSIVISSTYRLYKEVVEKNKFYSNYNLVNLNVDNNEINMNQFADLFIKADIKNTMTSKMRSEIQREDNIYINDIAGVLDGFDTSSFGAIEGRNLTADELRGNKKVALVGYGLKRLIITKAGKQTIKVFDEDYEVVGIVDNSLYFQYTTIVPLKSLDFFSKRNQFQQLVSKNDMDKVKKLTTASTKAVVRDIPKESVVNYLFEHARDFKGSLYEVSLGIVNLVLFSVFFSYNIKKKIAIMKVLGAKNIHVFKELLSKIMVLATIGVVAGLLLSKLTIDLMIKSFPFMYDKLNIVNILITSISIYVISIVVAFTILFKVINFKILKEIR